MRTIHAISITVVSSLVALALICGFYFAPQLRFYFDFHHLNRPGWWLATPRPIEDMSASTVPGTRLSYFGYEFEVPWSGIKKEANDGRVVRIFFNSGQDIAFVDPKAFENGTFPRISYESLRDALSMTPSRLTPFCSRRRLDRDRQLMNTKGLRLEHSGATDLFAIQTLAYRGFEVSGLQYNGRVELTFFNNSGNMFNLQLASEKQGSKGITQPEINRIINSFHPVKGD